MINGREFAVSENPVQVLESLDFAWMSYMQARRGAITLFSDVIYADVSNSGSFATSKTFSPHVSGTLGAALSADYRYWIVEAGGMYETNRWNFGNNYGGETDTWLEMLAGGRYWHQELDVDVALAGTVNLDGLVVSGARATARSGVVEWIDPFLGLRMRYKPAPARNSSCAATSAASASAASSPGRCSPPTIVRISAHMPGSPRRLPRLQGVVRRLRRGHRHRPLRVRRDPAGPRRRHHRPLLARAPGGPNAGLSCRNCQPMLFRLRCALGQPFVAHAGQYVAGFGVAPFSLRPLRGLEAE